MFQIHVFALHALKKELSFLVDKGHFEVGGCPRKFVGATLIDAINVAGMCNDGIMPAPGGLMDQSSWFVDLWSMLRAEENTIEIEKLERKRGSRH